MTELLRLEGLPERPEIPGIFRHYGGYAVPDRHSDAVFRPIRIGTLETLTQQPLPRRATVLEPVTRRVPGRFQVSFVWPDLALIELVVVGTPSSRPG